MNYDEFFKELPEEITAEYVEFMIDKIRYSFFWGLDIWFPKNAEGESDESLEIYYPEFSKGRQLVYRQETNGKKYFSN